MESATRVETFGDKLRAFAYALGVHLLCVLAVLVDLWWTHETRPVSMPGPVIEATLVGPTQAPKAAASAARPTPPKPAPTPTPPKPQPVPPTPAPAPKPEPAPQKETPPAVVHEDRIDQEKIARLAEQQAEQQKEQEEKQRRQQALLEQEQKQRQLEQQRKMLAEITKQREAAERKLKLEKERLAQLEDLNRRPAVERPPAPEAPQEGEQAQTGAGGQDDDLSARYAAAIQAAVTNSWNRPDSAEPGLRCTLSIVQIPGGDVLDATVGSPCNADPATRNSIEQAVRKAAPLPYRGYEKVFQRNIKFNFKYDG